MVHKTIETTGAPRPWRQNAIGKAFGKDAPPAPDSPAAKATNSRHGSVANNRAG
jgi:hypothetical protein